MLVWSNRESDNSTNDNNDDFGDDDFQKPFDIIDMYDELDMIDVSGTAQEQIKNMDDDIEQIKNMDDDIFDETFPNSDIFYDALSKSDNTTYYGFYDLDYDHIDKTENPSNIMPHDNFQFCHFCKYCVIFDSNEFKRFLENNLYKKINKKNMLMICRLLPNIYEHINYEYLKHYINIISKIEISQPHSQESWMFLFRIYFVQENLTYNDYIKCLCCNKHFCPKHQEIAPFSHKKCDCGKSIDLCNSCSYKFPVDFVCEKIHKKFT